MWSEPVGYLRVVENSGIADWRVRQLAAQQDGGSLGLDVFLIESTVAAFFFALCVDAVFMRTSVMHQERFEKLGFDVAEGTR